MSILTFKIFEFGDKSIFKLPCSIIDLDISDLMGDIEKIIISKQKIGKNGNIINEILTNNFTEDILENENLTTKHNEDIITLIMKDVDFLVILI